MDKPGITKWIHYRAQPMTLECIERMLTSLRTQGRLEVELYGEGPHPMMSDLFGEILREVKKHG